ncbi:MAG: hypothetical protein J3Q66DRAFT_363670 [Benniella sp.]|nr:MAG: hypothetical protein J3Q66DRAFT_363670 [Benniella sp.]
MSNELLNDEIHEVGTPQATTPVISTVTKKAKRNPKAFKKPISNEGSDKALTWLENPSDLTVVCGTSEKTPISERLKSKTVGLQETTTSPNKKGKGRWNVFSRQTSDRCHGFKSVYLTARPLVNRTGFGSTDKGRAKGITKLEPKRDPICHGSDSKELLFNKPDVEPRVETEIGANPTVDENSDVSENEDELDEFMDADDHQQMDIWKGSQQEPETCGSQSTGDEFEVGDPPSTSNDLQSVVMDLLTTSTKKWKGKDKKKALPIVVREQKSSQNDLVKTFTEAYLRKTEVWKVAEQNKLEFEKQKWAHEKGLQQKRLEQERELEMRRLDIEERRRLQSSAITKDIVQAALEAGKSIDEIKRLLELMRG